MFHSRGGDGLSRLGLELRSIAVCGLFSQKMGFPGGSDCKESACNAGDLGSIPGLGIPEEEMATLFSILVWRIPWTEEPSP